MKKILFISSFLICSSMMFGQFTINYSGGISNHPSTAVMMYLEVDSVIVDSTLTNVPTAGYSDSTNVTTRPFMIRILFYDCHGNEIADWHSPAPAVTTYNVNFRTLNYCTTTPCNANFTKYQAIDPITRLPIPNKAILVDGSTGAGLTYSWNFGDGSAPVSGLNVTHTYSTHGSYVVCLTVTSTTATGPCTSVFCDTLTVDSSGNVRSAFTVTTGNSVASIEDNNSLSSVKLYPNPARDLTVLNFESTTSTNLSIRILDVKGAEIQIITKSILSGSNLIELNTNNLQEGLYMIQLYDGNSFVVKRLQVVR